MHICIDCIDYMYRYILYRWIRGDVINCRRAKYLV